MKVIAKIVTLAKNTRSRMICQGKNRKNIEYGFDALGRLVSSHPGVLVPP
jgi:hypothetical protein